MFEQSLNPKSKSLAIFGFALSIICILGVVVAQLINSSAAKLSFQLNIMVIIFLTVVSIVGLVISIIALIRARRKPEVYGFRGFAVAGMSLTRFYSFDWSWYCVNSRFNVVFYICKKI